MIVKVIHSEAQFSHYFEKMDRDQFSPEGYGKLFQYYDSLSDETGEPYEIDVIAICCEWTEYDTVMEVVHAYNIDIDEAEDDESAEEYNERITETVMQELLNHTIAYHLENGNILLLNY